MIILLSLIDYCVNKYTVYCRNQTIVNYFVDSTSYTASDLCRVIEERGSDIREIVQAVSKFDNRAYDELMVRGLNPAYFDIAPRAGINRVQRSFGPSKPHPSRRSRKSRTSAA